MLSRIKKGQSAVDVRPQWPDYETLNIITILTIPV
jgi:hypothetical protein